jgi:hypothetical protein
MTVDELAADWLKRADDMDRTAKAYGRSCIRDKQMQLILLAKQLRGLVDEMRKELG